MKRAIKRVLTIFFSVVFSVAFCLFSSALSANEYGIGLSVNTNTNGEKADVSIKLSNANGFDVSGITVSHSIPDGLVLVASEAPQPHGSLSGTLLNIGTLGAGESYGARLTFLSASAADVAQTDAGDGGAATLGFAVFIVLLVVAAAVSVILVRRNKKAAALMLAAVLMLPMLGMFGVHAVGISDVRSFTLEDSVTLGGKSYPLSITVEYTASTAKNSYFELEAADVEDTAELSALTRPIADFSGTAVASGSVQSVTYEVRSELDGYEVSANGEAELDGCEWSVDSLKLKSGENEITFTATLQDGTTRTQVQTVTYDRGEIYRRTKAEEAEEGRTKYVKEIVNIYFDGGVSDERIEEILEQVGARRVGEINDIVMVQARVDAQNLAELNAKCVEIEEFDEVVLAGIEEILPLEINVTTNDPWNANPSYSETVNEDIPGGYNWHAEAVQAYSTWKHDSFFSTATVGIIDGPVMTDHEDLGDVIKFTGSYEADNVLSTDSYTKSQQFHGTHVAGIIGATPNNGIGVAGMLWDVEIYAANFSVASNALSYVVDAVSAQVTAGSKAVNLSLGLSQTPTDTYNPYENLYTEDELYSISSQCAAGMYSLISSDYEFVVVQSAGNGIIDTRLGVNVYRSVDASVNGLYCSIKKDTRYGALGASKVNEVYNRIIVVGAATNQSNNANGLLFEMAPFSNAGSRVDIYAPGYRVLSAVTPQANSQGNYSIIYGMASGTSQAAPIVTATAALCFAINPDFTGAQVKSLICAEENTRCTVYDYSNMQEGLDGEYYDLHPIEGDGRMLSMKLVIEAALRTVCGKASYTQLNRIVAAAQSLDPDDYTNYEIVQAVIDSIDYDLYAYQQDEVDAKYLELLDAMDKLQEKTAADYGKVEDAISQANALNPDDYVDFSGVTAAINAVVYGKYSDEQEAVNQMAQDILDAISALEPKASVSSNDPNIVADNSDKYIVLTAEYLDILTDSVSAEGGCSLTFEPNNEGYYSTGATATLSKEGYDDVVYAVAVLGDVDGSATVDANDAFLIRMYALELLDPTHDIYLVAADADCDGDVTESDSVLIQSVALLDGYIFNDYTPGA